MEVSLDVHNQPWNSGGDETNINYGQVGEEEVHGCVEMGVRAYCQDDEQVSTQCQDAHGQEEAKEDNREVWIL